MIDFKVINEDQEENWKEEFKWGQEQNIYRLLVETIDQVNFEIDNNNNHWKMKETKSGFTWSPRLSKIIAKILSKWE